MRIGIDGRFYNESGIGRYIRNLIDNLPEIENEYFVFLLKQDLDLDLPSNFHKVEADFSWYGLREQLKFPNLIGQYNLDFCHFPHFNVPIFFKGKFIVTIHDLIHQHFNTRDASTKNSFLYFLKKLGYKKVFKNALEKSQKIIVPSNFVKGQLIKEWRIKEEKICVIYEAVEEDFLKQIVTEEKISEVLNKFNITKDYLFYVGNAHPHKNIEGLIKAFNELKKVADVELVLSGKSNYFWKKILSKYHQIKYTDYVTDEELKVLYSKAKVFVMPSFEEGFGIPSLEALACGSVVASSNQGALPEILKNGAIYFDPEDITEMARKILRAMTDLKLRGELKNSAQQVVLEYSFKKMAQETLQQYLQI